jgi:hypothetical protein
LEELNGEKIVAVGLENLIAALREELADYLLTTEDRTDLRTIKSYLDQSVKTDAEPKFEGLQIGGTWNASTGKWEGGVSISNDGELSGAIFT